jgi:hypothetical protein
MKYFHQLTTSWHTVQVTAVLVAASPHRKASQFRYAASKSFLVLKQEQGATTANL